MNKLLIKFLLIITCTLISCKNHWSNYNPQLLFLNIGQSKTNGECQVSVTLPNQQIKVIDNFKCWSSTGFSSILYKDLIQTEYGETYGGIKSLTIPKDYGTFLKQYCIMEKYDADDYDINAARYNRYMLFKQNNNLVIVKEVWEQLKDNSLNGQIVENGSIILNEELSSLTSDKVSQNNAENTNSDTQVNKTFQGQDLKDGEKIVKIDWEMENKVNLTIDIGNAPRFCTKSYTVPNRKKWILLYINEDFTFNRGDVISSVPYLFIDDKEQHFYNRHFSNSSTIRLAQARDENFQYYSGSSIKAVSSRNQGDRPGEGFIQYKGELWFLETNE